MRKHMLVLTTSAAILACGAIGASAQAPDAQNPNGQNAPIRQSPSGPVPNIQPPSAGGPVPNVQQPSATLPVPQQSSVAPPLPRPFSGGAPVGMMGHQGAMGRGMMGSVMMRMMFALMDTDGDGKLSLQEFQAAHERIFRAMDANKDGFVTLQEMQTFMRGASTP